MLTFSSSSSSSWCRERDDEALEDKNKVYVQVFGWAGAMANNPTRMKVATGGSLTWGMIPLGKSDAWLFHCHLYIFACVFLCLVAENMWRSQ